MTGLRWTSDQLGNYQSRRGPRRTEKPAQKGNLKRDNPEERLQLEVARYLDQFLDPDWRWFHVPNEKGSRSTVNNKILKACGVKDGAPDVLILAPDGRFFWLELKSETGSLSVAQNKWRRWCVQFGQPWKMARSLESVRATLVDWGVPTREARP